MKERGLIFSGPMVRANLEGRKSQTRRISGLEKINIEPDRWKFWRTYYNPLEFVFEDLHDTLAMQQAEQRGQKITFVKPRYQIGDRFYMRETHYRYGKWVKNGQTKTGRQKWRFKGIRDQIRYLDERLRGRVRKNTYRKEGWYKRPSIHMPKWAARPERFEITDIRVERMQDISEEDAIAEGCCPVTCVEPQAYCTTRQPFQNLWNSINAKRGYGWQINPWVWVISYRKL